MEAFRTDLQGDIFCISDGKIVRFETGKQVSQEAVNPTVADGSGQNSQDMSGIYISNINSLKFYRASYNSFSKESNRVYFDNRSPAIEAGYVHCQNCDS